MGGISAWGWTTSRPPAAGGFYFNPDDVLHSCRMGYLDELPAAERADSYDSKDQV
jgi:hypothetical protein